MRLVFGIELGQFVEAQLARVVVLGDVLIFGKDAAAELRGGPFLVFEIILIGLEHGGIDLEAFLLERLGDFDGGIAVGHGTAGAAIYRGIAAHAEHGDFRALGKRQGVIAVFQQRVGLLRLVHGRLLKALVRFLGGFVFGFVRPAIAAVGGLVRYGSLASGTDERVKGRTVRLHDRSRHDGDGEKQCAHSGDTAPQACTLMHLLLLEFQHLCRNLRR